MRRSGSTRDDDELASLGLAFNRMTQQLSAQRGDLITANRLNEIRRRFTETVLSGVSAGVIGVDGEGKVTIVNRAAARLMDAAPEDLEASHYSEAVPELAPLILRAMSEPAGRAGGEVTIRRGGTPRTLERAGDIANAARPTALSSPSTTSPIWSAPSAPPPGPMWRAASPMRSRTR